MKHVLAAAMVLLLAGCAAAQEFSARIVWPEKKDATGQLYVSGTQFRADVIHDGKAEVFLLQTDKHPSLTHIKPANKTFSILGLDDEQEALEIIRWLKSSKKQLCDMPGLNSCKFLGLQSFEDRVCDDYEVVDSSGETYRVCYDQGLHFGITFSSKEDSIILTDIKVGKQPKWLFVVPRGFKKTSFF